MPKENKKRGRRGEQKKRKRDATGDEPQPKRHRTADDEAHDEAAFGELAYQDDGMNGAAAPEAQVFYGMLDEDEQEYFKKADELLELNQFESPEDRTIFLESVYKEAEGKELKIANSQSCSRLMERLILLSTPKQLKGLFKSFSGKYGYQPPC
jgi:nucleolar protein 9